MIMLKGNHAKGTAQFSDPGEAWDFKMEQQLAGASTKMIENTQVVLGVRTLRSPRDIRVSWTF